MTNLPPPPPEQPNDPPQGPYYDPPTGGYPPQHPGRRRGAIMTVSVVVVALVVVLGGGFAWPGWFRGEGTSGASNTVSAFVEAVNSRDVDAARTVLCPSLKRSDLPGQPGEPVSEKVQMRLAGKLRLDGDSATQSTTLRTATGELGLELNLIKRDGHWCINGIIADADASPPPSQVAGAKAAMRTLVSAINAGDAATAQGLVCPDALGRTKDNVTTAATEGVTISGFTVHDAAGGTVGVDYQYRKPGVMSERSGRMTLSHDNEMGWCLHLMT